MRQAHICRAPLVTPQQSNSSLARIFGQRQVDELLRTEWNAICHLEASQQGRQQQYWEQSLHCSMCTTTSLRRRSRSLTSLDLQEQASGANRRAASFRRGRLRLTPCCADLFFAALCSVERGSWRRFSITSGSAGAVEDGLGDRAPQERKRIGSTTRKVSGQLPCSPVDTACGPGGSLGSSATWWRASSTLCSLPTGLERPRSTSPPTSMVACFARSSTRPRTCSSRRRTSPNASIACPMVRQRPSCADAASSKWPLILRVPGPTW